MTSDALESGTVAGLRARLSVALDELAEAREIIANMEREAQAIVSALGPTFSGSVARAVQDMAALAQRHKEDANEFRHLKVSFADLCSLYDDSNAECEALRAKLDAAAANATVTCRQCGSELDDAHGERGDERGDITPREAHLLTAVRALAAALGGEDE